MSFWKSLFGGADTNPEEEKKNGGARNFDLLKYDGVKALRIRQYDYAVKCFQEALKIQDDLEVHDYLSQTLIRLGRLDEALAELQAMAEAQPDNVALQLQTAHVAYMQEDYDLMAQACEKAQALNPAVARTQYLYAQACLGKKELVPAIARLTMAVKLDDAMADARLLRGQILLGMKDVAGAQADVDWLLAHTADQEDVLLLAARLEHAKGDMDKAIAIYDHVNELNPFQLDAYRERGKIYYERGDKAAAEEEMKKLLDINPDELSGVNGEYKAEGVEEMMKRAYSAINPFGL